MQGKCEISVRIWRPLAKKSKLSWKPYPRTKRHVDRQTGCEVMTVFYIQNCMILTSIVFDWSTRVMDRWMGSIGHYYSQSACMLSRESTWYNAASLVDYWKHAGFAEAWHILTVKTLCITGSHASWKVMENPTFFFFKIPGPGESWKITLVLESPGKISLKVVHHWNLPHF